MAFVQDGGGQAEAARRFGVSLWCVRDWRARKDWRPEQKGVSRQRKLDLERLRAQVRQHPD
ncbi:MAG: IS630 family transposase, partial [Candidatus Competibacteraceae bacterium]|nr:IS630 family transposase [Candidatus Competibacteraceae bacterium]